MARLNESTASTEPIEILKRRFARQNREIARVNSIQSLRIRSLESEVSHLLSENVSLRERVIALGQEIEKLEAAKLFQDGVYDIKAKLSTKLMELGSLVADLNTIPCRFNKSASGTTEIAHQSQSNFDLRQNSVDLETNTGLGEDGRLPVILEDKYYPPEMLEPGETQELMNNEEDVSHPSELDEVSTIQKDVIYDDVYPRSPEDVTDIQEPNGGLGDNDVLFPPTLETRKKKKPNPSPIRETVYDRCLSKFPSRGDSGLLLKSSFKRKFSGNDDDGFELVPPEDDFQFSRPPHAPQMTHDQRLSTCSDHSSIRKRVLPKGSSKRDERPRRRVLEPKSTNMSSPEPQATRVRSQDHKVPTRIKDESDENGTMYSTCLTKAVHHEKVTVDEKSSHKDADKSRQEASEDEVLQSRAPEAKQSSVSAAVAVSQVQNDFEASTNLSGASSRSTRRQRSVVSYAEPNLRDKMRRPTKEFIAAVGGDHQSRRTSGSQSVRTTSNDGFDECKSGQVDARNTRNSDTGDVDLNPVSTTWLDDSLRPSITVDSKEVPIEIKNIPRAASLPSRQSRRHSSNPRSSVRCHSPEYKIGVTSIEGGLASGACLRDFNDASNENTDQSKASGHASEEALRTNMGPAIDAKQIRRVPRGAARRKSMML
ncbi:hypothetical protein BBP40_004859 [Aspergillus hancockii]|nr:hypothetical protein BBP40_004859 [Aspergillus hancockii]